jgi:hypothetical protein
VPSRACGRAAACISISRTNCWKTNSGFQTFNPSFSSSLNVQLSQPFLRDFKVDGRRYQIQVAKKSREVSDVQFRQTVVTRWPT